MRAFIRRFLMHYGIYRRYPMGRLPSLRNAWRNARAWSGAVGWAKAAEALPCCTEHVPPCPRCLDLWRG